MGMMDGQRDRQHLPLAACYVVLQRGRGAQWTSRGGASQKVHVLITAQILQTCGTDLREDTWLICSFVFSFF